MACAGICATDPVYPRVCGGAKWSTTGIGTRSGLSPRVRGSLNPLTLGPPSDGSIPACAGEPPVQAVLSKRVRVYPRVCGGALAQHRFVLPARGLSPRVRGSHLYVGLQRWGHGSIPACAGEPEMDVWCLRRPMVYPRVCGGAMKSKLSDPVGEGLSPRVRGSHLYVGLQRWGHGSIPACAGEPHPRAVRR